MLRHDFVNDHLVPHRVARPFFPNTSRWRSSVRREPAETLYQFCREFLEQHPIEGLALAVLNRQEKLNQIHTHLRRSGSRWVGLTTGKSAASDYKTTFAPQPAIGAVLMLGTAAASRLAAAFAGQAAPPAVPRHVPSAASTAALSRTTSPNPR